VKFGTSSAPDLLRRMNVEMPRLVARRFSRARIVAFSSGCVYPFVPPASGGAIEDTPVSPQGEYAQSCLARESAFADISRECGTRVLLLRLNYSVEFRYGLLLDIATKVAAGRPVDVTMGHCNVIWQGDAIAHTIQSLELAAQPARPLNITGPDLLSVRELAEAFGSLLSVPVTIEGTEAPTAWLNNAGESHRLLGRPSVAIETMLGWVAAWVKSGGESWGKPTGFERRDGKF
jgi:nucleoside-diphosphate-sugar epimerase